MRTSVVLLLLLLLLASPAAAQITPPNTFVPQTRIQSALVNENFSTIGDKALNREGGIMTGDLQVEHILPTTTNTYDLGSASFMVRSAYARTSLVLGQTGGNYTLTWANPAAARAISIADPGGTDVFTFNAATQTLTNKTLTAPTLTGTTTAGPITSSGAYTSTGAGGILWTATNGGSNAVVARYGNTGGSVFVGIDGDPVTTIVGATAYDGIITAPSGISISANGGGNLHMRLSSAGLLTTTALASTTIVQGPEATAGVLRLCADECDDSADIWNFNAGVAGSISIRQDATTILTISPTAVSNTQLYNSATLQPGFLVTNSATDTITDGSTLDFNNEVYDTTGSFASDVFTVPVTGVYQFCAGLFVGATDGSSSNLNLLFNTNTSDYYMIEEGATVTATTSYVACTPFIVMTTNDTIQITNNSSESIDVQGGASPFFSWFSGRLVP